VRSMSASSGRPLSSAGARWKGRSPGINFAPEHGERAVAADVAPGEVDEPSPGDPAAGPRKSRSPYVDSARRRPPTSRLTSPGTRPTGSLRSAGRRGRCAMPRHRNERSTGGCGHAVRILDPMVATRAGRRSRAMNFPPPGSSCRHG
jgi:hypothetical protein